MQLAQLLSNKTTTPSITSFATIELSGAIEADQDSDYIRLYREPRNTRSYMLVLKSDVIGDVHKWTSEELASSGYIGTDVFRIYVKHGAQVMIVDVKLQRLGETISGRKSASTKTQAGQCNNANGGCGTYACCTTASDGECYCDNCCVV